MSSNPKTSKTTAKERDQMLIAGIAKYLASVTKVTLAGTDYTATTLTTAFEAEISSLMALTSAKAQLAKQVADNRDLRATTSALRAALRAYILATYGAAAVNILGEFGLQAPKLPGPKTAEAKAVAAAKGAATRKARKAAAKAVGSAPPVAAPAAPAAK